MTTTRTRLASLVIAAVAAGVATATLAAAAYVATPIVMTPDGTDAYTLAAQPGSATVAAAAGNISGNLRDVWADPTSPASYAQESCTTWSESSWNDQEGAALRIRTTRGVTRAITVMKNVIFGATWVFNAHVFTGSTYVQFGTVNLAPTFAPAGVPIPGPWSLCAKIKASTLSFVVWPSTMVRPAYGTAGYGASWTIPAGWTYKGVPGWYAGHIHPGEHVDYTSMSTRILP